MFFILTKVTVASFGLIFCLHLSPKAIAQSFSPPQETTVQSLSPAFQTTPSRSSVLTTNLPLIAASPVVADCLSPEIGGEPFYIKQVIVEGNTVLQSEIEQLIKPFANREVSFEALICLRSKITELYIQNGYSNSGAFLPNNQDLLQGTVKIQVVEGELERIEISGLERLQQEYVLSRLELGANKPLNVQDLQQALELLQLNPLIEQVNAELTAGSAPGRSILLVNLTEAPAFHLVLGIDNYRPPSIGSEQGIISLSHDNLWGWGDRFYAEYDRTEGLDFYDIRYTVPVNAEDGTVGIRYWNSNSGIIQELFEELDIESQNETLSFNFRQPVWKTPDNEVALGLIFDLRSEQTFLLDQPFSFSSFAENGETNLAVLRFFQEWVTREATQVLALRSQFSFGLDLFGATINDLGVDGRFFAWQGQFQWVKQLPNGWLLLTRVDTQLTPDALLPLEQFSLGGIDTVRGYRQNQLLTDNGFLASVEVRIPLTADPSILQLSPFLAVGTGWNNLLPNPDPSTLVGIGMGLRWAIAPTLILQLDYGIPLVSVDNQGGSLQENGFYFSLRYQPF